MQKAVARRGGFDGLESDCATFPSFSSSSSAPYLLRKLAGTPLRDPFPDFYATDPIRSVGN